MVVAERYGCRRWHDVFFFCPEEIACLVAGELTSGVEVDALVVLYGEGIVSDAIHYGVEGVVGGGVDGCCLVLPVELIAASPLRFGLVIGELHVVGMVARGFECRCRTVFVVDDEDAYLVAIGKAAVVGPRKVELVNLAAQIDGRAGIAILAELVVTGSEKSEQEEREGSRYEVRGTRYEGSSGSEERGAWSKRCIFCFHSSGNSILSLSKKSL